MKILVSHDIEPLDGHCCSGKCPWRVGMACELFVTALVPLSSKALPGDDRARRSRDCKRSERETRAREGRLQALEKRLAKVASAEARVGETTEKVA